MDDSSESLWGIPVLNGENHDSWFRRYELKLRGKGVYYVVEQPMATTYAIVSVQEIKEGLEKVDPDSVSSKNSPNDKVVLNIEKRAQ
ncbi:hypothetical protein K3495_g3096 [Podosphaera aphanis]|nr:hypothetical protein K3495_g3096 [Podosphaera aphanis]